MQKNILITGCSSGLGLALTKYYLKKEYKVYGISRKKPSITNENFIHKSFDLSQVSKIKSELTNFIKDISNLETVFLNAGMLGKIKILEELSIDEIYKLFNTYSGKEVLINFEGFDYLEKKSIFCEYCLRYFEFFVESCVYLLMKLLIEFFV